MPPKERDNKRGLLKVGNVVKKKVLFFRYCGRFPFTSQRDLT